MPGYFVSFEGIDGSGKSLQARMLCERLLSDGVDAVICREPGGTRISEKIRELLLSKENGMMFGETEALLYAAARAQTVREFISPMLLEGKTVICDRFVDSSIAYQGFARSLGAERVAKINQIATGGLLPDITFFLDVDVDTAAFRRSGFREDRLECESRAFHERVREGYLELARGERFVIIDGRKTIEEINGEIVKKLCEKLSIHKGG